MKILSVGAKIKKKGEGGILDISNFGTGSCFCQSDIHRYNFLSLCELGSSLQTNPLVEANLFEIWIPKKFSVYLHPNLISSSIKDESGSFRPHLLQ